MSLKNGLRALSFALVATLTGCDTGDTDNTNNRIAAVGSQSLLADFVDDKGQLDPDDNAAFIDAEDQRLRQVLLDNGVDPDSATWERVDLDLSDNQAGATARKKCEGISGHYQQQAEYKGQEGSWHGWYKCGKLVKQMFCKGGGIAGCTEL